jgi:acyl carrier protein
MQVSPDEPLMAAGLDSLGSVELRNTLESSLALPLPPTLVMDYPTAAAIEAYAAGKMPAAAAEPTAAPAVSLPPAAVQQQDDWAWLDGGSSSSGFVSSSAAGQLQRPAAPMSAVQPLAEVESEVSAAVASILGRTIGSSDALMASGLDSLASVELQNVLQASFALPLPATLALDYPSVSALAGFIHAKLAATAGAVAVPGAVTAPAAAVRGSSGSSSIGVFGSAFVLPGAFGRPGSDWQGLDAIKTVPLER